ncbi:MAG: transglycosylase SLT domain-containing protein [Sulfurimonas sp.]|nr:transglycosylase SLT domain-containing protein [Sulfurimonas sp.]
MRKRLLLLALLTTLLSASSSEKDTSASKSEFEAYKQAQNKEFKDYKTKMQEEYKNYKKELSKYWEEPKLSSKKQWVSYTKDKKSRSNVDFAKNSYSVEVIAKTLDDAKKKLKERITYIAGKNTKEVVQTDPLQKKIAQISKSPDVVSSSVNAKPILTTLLFPRQPSKAELNTYAMQTIQANKITQTKAKDKKENIYKVVVKLPKNSKIKLSAVYQTDVSKNSKEYKMPVDLLFAIMQTESDFNPFAKSHIPAYGLMQLVPWSGGADAYRMIYKKKGKPSATYLYNSSNNIQMGTAYLHILYYRYLRKIKDPQSRLYCTIAAYNTGAGNIAWAFTRTTNMNKAAPKINAMTSEQVYAHLLSNLKYDEPKHYLKRVNKRMKVYKIAYRDL